MNKVTIIDESICDLIPKELEIYTTEGTFKLKLSDVTREFPVIRVTYHHSTFDESGDPLMDGEPDYLVIDLHFVKNDNGLKILVNITYGDQMKSEFSLKSPNKVEIGHYNGWGSKADPQTHFSFSDKSILKLIEFFNRFDGFKTKRSDFNFLDKYKNSFKYESIKILHTFNNGIIMVVNNTNSDNIIKYLNIRGIPYKIVNNIDEAKKCKDNNILLGAILTDADLDKGVRNDLNIMNYWCLDNLNCPIIGIGFGYLMVCKRYGSKIIGVDLTQDHFKINNTDHILFKELVNPKFSFHFNQYPISCPNGFSVISKMDKIICGISNDVDRKYGFLFRPEDVEFTYKLLDNFIGICHPIDKDVRKLKGDRILNYKSFSEKNIY